MIRKQERTARTCGPNKARGHLVAICALIACNLPAAAVGSTLDELGAFVPGYVASFRTDEMPSADFDGDGLADLVALGSNSDSDVIQIVGVDAVQGWRFKQVVIPPTPTFDMFGGASLSTWTAFDGPHLLYQRGNRICDYSGWPLQLARQWDLPTNGYYSGAEVADVNGDGDAELVVATAYSTSILQAYSLANGALLWQVPGNSGTRTFLHVAQLDADPALEIIVTGAPGTIVDGATHAIEWRYKDGIGPLVEHGRFGGSTPRFASIADRILMFQSGPWSPLWDTAEVWGDAASVVDVDGDDIDELVYASGLFPSGLRVFDVMTQSTRMLFPGPTALQLQGGEFDGDANKEIAIGPERYSSNSLPSFRVLDAESGAIEFENAVAAAGPFVTGGILPGTGSFDVIVGSRMADNLPGAVSRRDSVTGSLRWQTPAPLNDYDIAVVDTILLADVAGQPHAVALVSGTRYGSSYPNITAYDSDDGIVLWNINSDGGDLPSNERISGMAAVDRNGDQITDAVLVCTSDSRLRLFDTNTRALLWTSVAMTGNCQAAMQLQTGGATQLVAVLDNVLRAYDAQTHLLTWSLSSPYYLTGATYLRNGVSGPELALFDEGGITFYDAETRAELRRVVPPDDLLPVNALKQPSGALIRELLVAGSDRLAIMDGESGSLAATSGPLGHRAGLANAVSTFVDIDGSVLVAVGGEVAVTTHRFMGTGDVIFADGFESVP